MNLHDPTRPLTLSGLPALLPHGMCIVPHLYLLSTAPSMFEVSVWLPTENYRTFGCFTINLRTDEIPAFLIEWKLDPETVLIDKFGWEEPASDNGSSVVNLSTILANLLPKQPKINRRL